MAIYYINEDLTTGNNDGTSEADAYQGWGTAVSNISSLSEDSTINFDSDGVVDVSRILNITLNNYKLNIYFIDNAIAVNTAGYTGCFQIHSIDSLSLITFTNARLRASSNGYGIRMVGNTDVKVENLEFIGTSARRALYNTSTATLTVDGLVSTNSEYTIGNTSTGVVNASNCYGNATVQAYFDSGSGTLNLTTCASNDTSGSSGLQNISYDTSLFTTVTTGSEDFHLVAGSSLIGAGTTTSLATDIDGDNWLDPRDIGIYFYSAPVTPTDFSYSEMAGGFISTSGGF